MKDEHVETIAIVAGICVLGYVLVSAGSSIGDAIKQILSTLQGGNGQAPNPNTGQPSGIVQGAGSLGGAVGGVLNDLGGMISNVWNPPFLTGSNNAPGTETAEAQNSMGQ